jgi:thiosulfate reductase cytochrome b subunit
MNRIEACCRIFRRTRTGSDRTYGHPFYAPGGGLLPHGALGWLLAVVIIYVIIHVLTGHARHRLSGRRASYGWSVMRGPWFSLRLTRHLRWRS